jgi:hypothetical protein
LSSNGNFAFIITANIKSYQKRNNVIPPSYPVVSPKPGVNLPLPTENSEPSVKPPNGRGGCVIGVMALKYVPKRVWHHPVFIKQNLNVIEMRFVRDRTTVNAAGPKLPVLTVCLGA